jgi:predicted nuclease of predicted toxin-antitoxin system
VHLLLDANLSPKRIGAALAEQGHEVLALAADPALGALDDPDVLALAAEEQRVLVTRNAKDFAPLLREWAEAGRTHAGCILIWTLAHHEFGTILDGVTRLLTARPPPQDWQDVTVAL